MRVCLAFLCSIQNHDHGLVGSRLTNLNCTAETVITSFPRRWAKNKPDPSAVHKSLRMRLKSAHGDEIQSAFDLALIIIDECSRVFFDRTKATDRQPNLVDIFAEAISGVVSFYHIVQGSSP